MPEKSFWKNKKVFLTGHTGFKGAWLCLILEKLGADITGYSLDPPSDPNLFELCGLKKTVRSIRGDIRDIKKLEKALISSKARIVIHMAAQPLVRDSYLDPIYTYGTNVMGTVNILEASKKAGDIKSIVNVTTDKCYENPGRNKPFKENEPLGGFDPYSSSKACSELVTSAYRRSFDLPAASARSGNVIGGGDWGKDRIIPDLFSSVFSAKKLLIRYPKATRPWQHVLEPLFGYLILAEKLFKDRSKYTGAWNFGPLEKDEKTVEWIVKRISDLWSGGVDYKIDKSRHPHEAHYLRLDSSKARKELGWRTKWKVRDAVDLTVSWFEGYKNGADARSLCCEQINEYSGE
jgi:CDP-glucose 4,6-dehydratase